MAKSKCSSCVYRCVSPYQGTCDYATITGHCRVLVSPEWGDNCTAYRKGRRRLIMSDPNNDTVFPKNITNKPVKPKKKPRKKSDKVNEKTKARLAAEEIAAKYYATYCTDIEIAKLMGRSKQWVCGWRKRTGRPPIRKNDPRRANHE